MAAVIIVFSVWLALLVVAATVAIAVAPRVHSTGWMHRLRSRGAATADAAVAQFGRVGAGAIALFAAWSVVIIIGWPLGLAAHRLEHAVDRPFFAWWQDHHLGGPWHHAWIDLTNIGSPTVTQILAVAGAVLTAALYARRRNWWVPPVILLVGYLAEKYAQTILKLVVHRGHPPTTLGSYPSGGMGRLIEIYGLIIFFVILRFWPRSPRMWAIGGSVLAMFASIQAYARINNLEHWLTDVIGGTIFGILLLAMMIIGYWAMARLPVARPAETHSASPAAPSASGNGVVPHPVALAAGPAGPPSE